MTTKRRTMSRYFLDSTRMGIWLWLYELCTSLQALSTYEFLKKTLHNFLVLFLPHVALLTPNEKVKSVEQINSTISPTGSIFVSERACLWDQCSRAGDNRSFHYHKSDKFKLFLWCPFLHSLSTPFFPLQRISSPLLSRYPLTLFLPFPPVLLTAHPPQYTSFFTTFPSISICSRLD